VRGMRAETAGTLDRPHDCVNGDRRHLVLVGKRRIHWEDFHAIAAHIRQVAPDVRPVLLTDHHINNLRFDVLLRPTLVVSPNALKKLRIYRGRVLQGNRLCKSLEYAALERVGVPVPRWVRLTKDDKPDLSAFGKYVVSKPDSGGRGAEVRILRRGRVRWKRPENESARGNSDLLIQEFIYTGEWPSSYRVATLLGKAIYSWKVQADRRRRPLADPNVFGEGAQGGGMSIVSTGKGCTFELNLDEEIIALGERAHAAFPQIPLLGVDIVRDALTGKLYVLEVNASGKTWSLSSPAGRAVQSCGGFDFIAQFDSVRRAAQIRISETRRLAA
jgi:hypothetical protein